MSQFQTISPRQIEAIFRNFAEAGETLQETAKLLGAGQSNSLEARLAGGQG